MFSSLTNCHVIHPDPEVNITRLVQRAFDECGGCTEEDINSDLNNVALYDGGMPMRPPASPAPGGPKGSNIESGELELTGKKGETALDDSRDCG